MRFGWDETERALNLGRHRLGLLDGPLLFDGRSICTFPSPRGNEMRFATTGAIGPKFYTVVWTWRRDAVRLISFRRARDAEERQHRQRVG